MPEKLELSVNLINNILGYLGSQPYQSVAGLIQAIQQEVQPQLPTQEAEVETSE